MAYYTDYLIKAKGSFVELTELQNFLSNQRIHSDDLTEEEKEKWEKRRMAFPFACTFPHGQVTDEEIYYGIKGIKGTWDYQYRLAMVMSFKHIWSFGIVLYIQDYLKRMNNNAKVMIYSLFEGIDKSTIHFVDKDYTYTLLKKNMYRDLLNKNKEGLHDEVEIELEGNKHLFNYFLDIKNKEAVREQVGRYESTLIYRDRDNWDYSDDLIISGYFAPHPDWFYLAAKRSKLIAAHSVDHYGEKLFLGNQYTTPWMRSFF